MSAVFQFNVLLVPSFMPIGVTINKPGPMSFSKVLKDDEFKATVQRETGMDVDSLKFVDLGSLEGGSILGQDIGENLWIVFIPGYGVDDLEQRIKTICAVKGMTAMRRNRIQEPLGNFMADTDVESVKSFSEFLLGFIKKNIRSEEGNTLQKELQGLLASMEEFMSGEEYATLKGFASSADCPSSEFFGKNLQIILDCYSDFLSLFDRFTDVWATSSVPKNCVGKEELEELKEWIAGEFVREDSFKQEMSNVTGRLRGVEEALGVIEDLQKQLEDERKEKAVLAQQVAQLEGKIGQLQQNFESLLCFVRTQVQSSEDFKKALGESVMGLNQARSDISQASQALNAAYSMSKK